MRVEGFRAENSGPLKPTLESKPLKPLLSTLRPYPGQVRWDVLYISSWGKKGPNLEEISDV